MPKPTPTPAGMTAEQEAAILDAAPKLLVRQLSKRRVTDMALRWRGQRNDAISQLATARAQIEAIRQNLADAQRGCQERDARLSGMAAATAEPVAETGYYIACFKGSQKGYVCWWAPGNHGYTNSLSAAGVYQYPVPNYHDDGDDNVPVPVAFARKLAVRQMVDIGDTGNDCMWNAATLRAALAEWAAAREAPGHG